MALNLFARAFPHFLFSSLHLLRAEVSLTFAESQTRACLSSEPLGRAANLVEPRSLGPADLPLEFGGLARSRKADLFRGNNQRPQPAHLPALAIDLLRARRLPRGEKPPVRRPTVLPPFVSIASDCSWPAIGGAGGGELSARAPCYFVWMWRTRISPGLRGTTA